ncbi:MAG: hypothetical protein IJO54_07475 [Oscillospiraceae bacterium]|nr:hypothetical protein [Oscillospiraceae bacterium]
MKNSSMYTALAAFIAFVGAAAYAVLFFMGFLPSGFLFAQTGITIAVIVLVLLTVSAAYCGCKAKHCLHNSIACFGKALIFAAVVTLCISVLLLILPAATTAFYTTVLFLTVFFWKFLLILWAFSLAVTIPCYCYIDDSCPAASENGCSGGYTTANSTDTNSCRTTSNYSTAGNYHTSGSCYTNSRYNY